ncbi:CYFA0S01e03422g1_1 [Cyberlindnera fabianii]|uniref:CYFA0S01e03422g1_1 n=1 Tax=Cyberlindnera fabianii TaxID=36022 RepID=A0A061AGG6_CYBFA|nr:CYFA0S01e03422g1_1 [Cyberlindnera fabianii]
MSQPREESSSKYAQWGKEQLVERVLELEQEMRSHAVKVPRAGKAKKQRPLDFSKHNKRFIALRFAYLGWNYNGLAIQKTPTPLPTVEGTLIDAMNKCKLIPSTDPSDFKFSRCGRTDRGVSAMNQVVSLMVRSNLTPEEQMDPTNDNREIDYINILNSLLPDDVKIHAVCLRPPDGFDARFSCVSRHYKYLFHRGDLDIEAMQTAAGYYLGEHDFRNFCKLDGSKQITNFKRSMLVSQILELNDGLCCFDLEGSAFLWHQVRNMVAVLFLVGQRLEKPEIVKELVDVDNYPTKPLFEMGADFPLVLYDCKFEGLEWKHAYENTKAEKTCTVVYSNWLENNIKSQVSRFMMDLFPEPNMEHMKPKVKINTGDGVGKVVGEYVPLAKRERHDSYEEVNDRWLKKQKNK